MSIKSIIELLNSMTECVREITKLVERVSPLVRYISSLMLKYVRESWRIAKESIDKTESYLPESSTPPKKYWAYLCLLLTAWFPVNFGFLVVVYIWVSLEFVFTHTVYAIPMAVGAVAMMWLTRISYAYCYRIAAEEGINIRPWKKD